jgi:nucleoside-diphosphate-sugar epimerase
MIPAAINSWNHPWTIVDRMRKGKKVITPGDGTSLWTCTHNTDFAKGFLGLMGNIQTLGHAFHITSHEVLTWDQIYKAIGAAAGAEPKIVHVPSDLIAHFKADEGTGSMLGDKAHSVVFDNTKLKTFVPGYVATMPFARGVRQTIEYFEAHPKMCSVDAEYEKFIDDVVAAQQKAYS